MKTTEEEEWHTDTKTIYTTTRTATCLHTHTRTESATRSARRTAKARKVEFGPRSSFDEFCKRESSSCLYTAEKKRSSSSSRSNKLQSRASIPLLVYNLKEKEANKKWLVALVRACVSRLAIFAVVVVGIMWYWVDSIVTNSIYQAVHTVRFFVLYIYMCDNADSDICINNNNTNKTDTSSATVWTSEI